MSWPPSLPSTGFIAEGYTTITWGTDWAASNGLNGYIVKNVRDSERNEDIPIPNGTGLTATQIIIKDGYNYEVTVVDDTTIPAPTGGNILSLQYPGINSPFNFICITADYNAARKQEGERVMMLKAFTAFSL